MSADVIEELKSVNFNNGLTLLYLDEMVNVSYTISK
jgi:hypothetical protein